MSSLGRGRGVNVNKPAWLVQKERDEAASTSGVGDGGVASPGGGGGGGGGDDDGRYADADRDDYDRGGGGGGGGGDREERDQFGRIVGGGGRRGDDRHDGGRRGGWGEDRRRGGMDDRRGGGGGRRDDDRHDDRRSRGGGGGGRGSRSSERRGPPSAMHFRSYEEERDWVDDRRRARRARKSLFDVEPTPEQLAEDEARAALEASHAIGGMRTGGLAVGPTGANIGLNGVPLLQRNHPSSSSSSSSSSSAIVQPQQTRHARRLYVGNIPDLSEDEVHAFFRDAIRDSIVLDPSLNPNAASHKAQYVDSDPIISVYINRERRFVFLEFKTMEITSACLALDGVDVMGRGKVKVKRPNDYNAALAPLINAAAAPRLDTARLGIVSSTVPDGPNKIFIGGLPYHLNEAQVLELLSAFGTVKAFHLVKQDNTAVTSKGYCFVACMGLNGMDMGGGKQLSCRMAALQFSGVHQGVVDQQGGGAFGAPVAAPPVQASVVDGVDVDALLMAALGGVGGGMVMPAPMMGMIPGIVNPTVGMGPMGAVMQQQQQLPGTQMGMYGMGVMSQQPQGLVVPDPMAVAKAAASALDAAFGGGSAAVSMALPPSPAALVQQSTLAPSPTRVLVLLNMVMDEDLATDDNHKMLEEEVREEVSRYGKLISMKIPRHGEGYAPSAVTKIFLEYASMSDAINAERELKGRAFGPNVVDVKFFGEEDYSRNNLS
ncbi:hypothetical protein ACHAXA_001596 [Cyclostephanos tholiformis]|uniref:RRM domain-containing protein n=1 Tax=Cyclostephanos tholiformis TaxID=382380 RepID=A0ABD3RAZ6_9STRA